MTVRIGNNNVAAFTTPFSWNGDSGVRFCGMQYVAALSGNVSMLHFYANGDHDLNIKLELVNAAGAVLGTTTPIAIPAGVQGWVSGAIATVAAVAGQTYTIGAYSDGGVNGRVGVMTDGSYGTWIDTTSGTYAAPPATLSALGFDGGGVAGAFYADDSGAGDTTAPSITAGPTAANLAQTGYDVRSTWDEACDVSVLVTAVGASQPTDAEFDASTEKATATAGVQVSIHHNG